MFPIIKQVIMDWHVIVAVVAVVLYLNFISYIVSYKKSRSIKMKQTRTPVVKKAEPEHSEETSEEESSDDSVE